MRSAVDRVSNMEGRLDAECEAYVDRLSAHVSFQLGHSPPGTRAAVSDISFHFPLWFALALLAIEFWHVPFAVAVLFWLSALLARGTGRAVLIVLAIAMTLPGATALALWQLRRADDAKAARYEEATSSTLAASQAVDGFLLPAGTRVRWTDASHEHLQEAWSKNGAFGANLASVDHLGREPDGWYVTLSRDGTVDGWQCKADPVKLTPDRGLAECRTATDTSWKGWALPAGTLVETNERRGLLNLVVPSGNTVDVPQVGTITPEGGFSLFSDVGSIYQMFLDENKPLVVHGARLGNTVTWLYGDKAHLPGLAVAVAGTLINDVIQPAGTFEQGKQVKIDLATGRLTRCGSSCGP